MASYTANTDMTLEEAIVAGAMVSGESLRIQSGATVTCNQTPSIMMYEVTIDEGEFLLDGLNLTAGNMINFVMEYLGIITVNGRGSLRTTGGWYSLGTSDGTDSQVFDLSTYFNNTLIDIVPMIQVETGRRIDYTGAVGTAPAIDDFIYKTSDRSIMGRIVGVYSTYVVVKYLTGVLVNGDAIEIRRIEDNNGPDLQCSWTATVNNVLGDIKEAGIYQVFGNSRANGISYISAFHHGVGGFVFDQAFQSATLTMGGNSAGATGGFVPPTGCDIRIPTVHFSTSDATNFPLGLTYHDGTATEGNQVNLSTGGAGEIHFHTCNLGSVSLTPNYPSLYEAYFTGALMEMGCDSCPTKVIIEDCVVTSDCMNRSYDSRKAFKAFDLVNGLTIKNSLVVCPQTEGRAIGADTSNDILIEGNIHTSAGAATWETVSTYGGYKFLLCSNITLKNNISVTFDGAYSQYALYFEGCINVYSEMILYSASQTGLPQANEREAIIAKNNCSDVKIVGIEIIDNGLPGDNLVEVTDIANFKCRCFGMIDDKVDFGTDAEFLVQVQGASYNVDIARMWKTGGATPIAVLANKTTLGLTVQNCSGTYYSEIDGVGADMIQWKGVHGGSDGMGNSNGVETDYPATYGSHVHDIFRSDTTGAVFIIFPPQTANTLSSYTVIAGAPKFFRDGDVDLAAGDIIEYYQQYYMLGHTGFTGVVTTTTASATDGQDEWGTGVTKEFQYDVNDGNGFNGTWLDLMVPANLTGITVDPAIGVKLKFRFTCTADRTNCCGLMVHTTTTIADQKANFYPIDQNTVTVRINVIDIETGLPIPNAMVLVEADAGGPLTLGDDILLGLTNALGYIETQSFLYSADQPITGKVRKSSVSPYYKSTKLSGTITANGFETTILLVKDE